AFVAHTRPDVRWCDLRGNVDSRVRKVLSGTCDAAILAAAGLERLGLLGSAGGASPLPVEDFVPAAGQGAICVQCRADDGASAAVAAALDDPSTALAVTIEREVLAALGGGCMVPIGAHARVANGKWELIAAIAALDGSSVVRRTAGGTGEDADAIFAAAKAFGHAMLADGGREMVEAFRSAGAGRT
ncbi:MAG TPA: hypothetical protein VEJ20_07675, partial [Candidatus Eremiobacteraceae bacterium]|nr:hypothetical protein [Candidatus Eremiobacteraceae bacterium]